MFPRMAVSRRIHWLITPLGKCPRLRTVFGVDPPRARFPGGGVPRQDLPVFSALYTERGKGRTTADWILRSRPSAEVLLDTDRKIDLPPTRPFSFGTFGPRPRVFLCSKTTRVIWEARSLWGRNEPARDFRPRAILMEPLLRRIIRRSRSRSGLILRCESRAARKRIPAKLLNRGWGGGEGGVGVIGTGPAPENCLEAQPTYWEGVLDSDD